MCEYNGNQEYRLISRAKRVTCLDWTMRPHGDKKGLEREMEETNDLKSMPVPCPCHVYDMSQPRFVKSRSRSKYE